MRALLLSALVLCIPAPRVLAQSTQSIGTLRGIAYDSLRGQPLAGAFVTIRGEARSATSDTTGRFAFDSLAPRAYVLTMQHDALDSIGLSGITKRVTLVPDAISDVVLSIPSFAAMWGAACLSPTPADSGIVFGTIRDASSRNPLAAARVAMSWINLSASGTIADIRQRRWRYDVVSDSSGSFTFCGVPTDASLQLNARADSLASGLLNLRPGRQRIHRVDLFVGKTAATARASIVGKVTNQAGAPIRDARVVMEELPEVRTNTRGDFVMRNVPAGTQQVEVLALGMLPVVRIVDVAEGDTVIVNAQLERVTTLEGVNVTAPSSRARIVAAFGERRQLGLGRFQDSTWIGGHGTVATVLQEFNGVKLKYTRGGTSPQYEVRLPSGALTCKAILFIDRQPVRDHAELSFLRPDEIATMEVYTRAITAPAEFQVTGAPCGVVAIWTKRFFP